MWLLQLKHVNSHYYGSLVHPFPVFTTKEEAEQFIEKNDLSKIVIPVPATNDLIAHYFTCSF